MEKDSPVSESDKSLQICKQTGYASYFS